MSAMNIDKPLDDIITSKRSAKRGSSSRGGPGGAARTARGGGGRAPAPAGGVGPQRNARGSAAAAAPARPAQPQFAPDTIPGDKVVVSNLPEDVTEAQIRELFAQTIGPLSNVSLSYNQSGKSKGVATVQFRKAIDAQKAYKQYNGRLIDQKRPMKVEIIYDPTKAPPAPLTSRIAPPPAQTRPAPKAAAASATVAAAGGGAGGRKRRSGRGGASGPGRASRPKATVEDLDAEMMDYQAAGQAAK